ncbi:GNAT family N-acetyltransferase [Roseateles oligotrophus]|uniref:GNAT family N-acetyltransferase n=1 Tax=Roseateles oligotrophus TaxID=1769250 RepID=A0ABT2YCS9_9BURK|nr:GNAT family N-acetyltransferase [Roseateles oligotrophus]MCV2367842.1 GNAT family N-acetyltransferase [Roseateles oligotrophus]
MRRLAASNFQLGALPLQNPFIDSLQALHGQHFGRGQIWVARATNALTNRPAPSPTVQIEASTQAEVQVLLSALDQEQDRLLRPKPHIKAKAALRRAGSRLAVVRDAQMRVIACGALLLHEDYAELACLMVTPSRRGQGLGQLLLNKLEGEALRLGRPVLRLQVDVRQHALHRLAERGGFRRCGPFDGRRADPFGVFMEKLLGA